nr:unnamed protein product [Ipomoea trifida]
MAEKDEEFLSHKLPSPSQVGEELKELWGMALPITAMNCLVYVRAFVSVLFLGRLGSLELAGGALSIGFTNITGYSVLVGLASGLEPVCSQAYGSKNWDLLRLSLHRMICILLVAIVPISLLWLNLEPIMVFMGQDKEITSMAATYCLYSLPDLLTNTLLQPLRVYLRSQGVTKPQMWCTFAAVVFHVPLNFWWWYEIVTVLAGYLPNPRLTVAATGIIIQTTSLMYTVPMALAGCVSARVGNELGAGKPYKAKLAAMVALACAYVIGFMNVIWTVIFREKWVGLFTKDEMLKALAASVLPIIGLCELGNCPQTTGCGILRGTARPAVGARINLGSFYFVGTPVAVGLAFWLKLGFGGLWFGLLSAQAACAISIIYAVLCCTDWEAEALKAKKLIVVEMGQCAVEIKHEESKGLLVSDCSNTLGDVL